jgi:hypothetical protein
VGWSKDINDSKKIFKTNLIKKKPHHYHFLIKLENVMYVLIYFIEMAWMLDDFKFFAFLPLSRLSRRLGEISAWVKMESSSSNYYFGPGLKELNHVLMTL